MWALLAAASCWGGKGSETPARNKKNAALVVKAQQLLATAQELDYEAPKRTRRFDARNKAAELYRQDCVERAEVASCVMAVSLMAHVADADEKWQERMTALTDVLAAMCLDQRNDAACRVFDAPELQTDSNYSNAAKLCERGLADACYAAGGTSHDPDNVKLTQRACDLGDWGGCQARIFQLEGEGKKDESAAMLTKQRQAEEARCARGFGISCTLAASVDATRPATADTPAKQRRAAKAVADGCKRGYLIECEWAGDPEEKETLDMVARACTLTGRSCDQLANLRRERKELATSVRDALEHGCQFRDGSDCIDLVKGYRAKEYPEPVRNRANAIVEYWCAEGTPAYDESTCTKLKKL